MLPDARVQRVSGPGLATEQKLRHVAVDDFRRYKPMQKWYLDIGDILVHWIGPVKSTRLAATQLLAYVNDTLLPHIFEEISHFVTD